MRAAGTRRRKWELGRDRAIRGYVEVRTNRIACQLQGGHIEEKVKEDGVTTSYDNVIHKRNIINSRGAYERGR